MAWGGLQLSPRCWSRAGTGQDPSRAPGRAFLAPSPAVLRGRATEGMKGPSKGRAQLFWGFIVALQVKGAGLVRIPNELCSRKSLFPDENLCLCHALHCSGLPAHSSSRVGVCFPNSIFWELSALLIPNLLPSTPPPTEDDFRAEIEAVNSEMRGNLCAESF